MFFKMLCQNPILHKNLILTKIIWFSNIQQLLNYHLLLNKVQTFRWKILSRIYKEFPYWWHLGAIQGRVFHTSIFMHDVKKYQINIITWHWHFSFILTRCIDNFLDICQPMMAMLTSEITFLNSQSFSVIKNFFKICAFWNMMTVYVSHFMWPKAYILWLTITNKK